MSTNIFRSICSTLLAGATGLFVISYSSGWRAWFFIIAVSFWLGSNAIRKDE